METFTWEERDGGRWVALEGDLDHQACLALKDRFEEVVLGGHGDVFVVMTGVTFIGSIAVGLLLHARAELQKQDRGLTLSGAPAVVLNALRLMNLDTTFQRID